MPDEPRLPTLLCFSHLRWGFVWQRPQHLMSRLANDFNVTFVEEPEYTDGAWTGARIAREGAVTVLTPLIPASADLGWGFNDLTNPLIQRILSERTAATDAGDVVWHYTPMSVGAAPKAFDAALVVYDAMDELANFRGAPHDIVAKEHSLLTVAGLVFTGGPSLFERRRQANPHAHCFPSGVDAGHFRPDDSRIQPADAASWIQPVLGYYGVLDERIDFDLVAAVADLRPAWTIVLIGPLAKIGSDDLPRRDNIVYLGKRDYRDLPAYLDRFDIAIMPFALNDATRFISPTKTLEYLAAGKRVISTPIRDVIDLYGAAVEIASTPAEFVACADDLLAGRNGANPAAAQALVDDHGWDAIAQRMLALIDERRAQAEQTEYGRFVRTR